MTLGFRLLIFFVCSYFLIGQAGPRQTKCTAFYSSSKFSSLRPARTLQLKAASLLDKLKGKSPSSKVLSEFIASLPVYQLDSTSRSSQLKVLASKLLNVAPSIVRVAVIQNDESGEAEVYRISSAEGLNQNTFIVKLFTEEGPKGGRRFIRELAAQNKFGKHENSDNGRAAEAYLGGVVKLGTAEIPFLFLDVAQGKSVEEITYSSSKSQNPKELVDSMGYIGKQIAQFHEEQLTVDISKAEYKRAYKNINDEHFVKYRLWLVGDSQGDSQLRDLQSRSIVSESESHFLQWRLESILTSYQENLPTTLGKVHGDLKPGNLFFDSSSNQVTFIDTETLAKNWKGLADPIEDLARLYAGIARHGILGEVPAATIKRAQENLLRGYLIERGQTLSEIRSSLDFYIARYIGVLLRRKTNEMSPAQERQLLQEILPLNSLSQDTARKIDEVWHRETSVAEETILPDVAISLTIKRTTAQDLFGVVLKNWETHYSYSKVQQILERAQSKSTLNDNDLADLKDVRKRVRWLRTAFITLSADHRPPEELHAFVKDLGSLCDAIENDVRKPVKDLAIKVMGYTENKVIERSVLQFHPSSEAGISDYIFSEFEKMLKSAGRKTLKADEFHDLRKEVSRLQQVMRLSYISNPRPEVLVVMDYLGVINKMTRKIHDGFISRHLKGKEDYDQARVDMPMALNQAIQALLNRLGKDRPTEAALTEHLDRIDELLKSAYEDFDSLEIPSSVDFSVTKDDSKKMFEIAKHYWLGSFDQVEAIATLKKIENSLSDRNSISFEDWAYLKTLRKRAMLIRYLYLALDVNHKSPPAIDKFIVWMGKMNDAIANGSFDVALDYRKKLISHLKVTQLDLKNDSFNPAPLESNRTFLKNLVFELKQNVAKETHTVFEFHSIRKRVRLVQAVLRLAQAVEPSAEMSEIIKRIHKINERTGKIHDSIVSQALLSVTKNRDENVKLPPELAYDIDRILGLLSF